MAGHVFIGLAIVLTFSAFSIAGQTYSCRADLFMTDAYIKKPIVWSPDRSKHVRLWSTPENVEPGDDGSVARLSIYSGKSLLKTIILKDLSAGTFVKWSSDSKALYVMWSDGGAIGNYHVRAFTLNRGEAIESPAPRTVAAAFARHHYCKTRGNNLYAIRWLNGSEQLLLAPEVYPTGDCGRDLGFSAGYLANAADGKIVKKYTSKQLPEAAQGCPSNIFPTALTTQQEIEDLRRTGSQRTSTGH